jgi:hypothetical protein
MLKKILWLVLLSSTLLFATDNNNTKLEDANKTDAIHQKIAAIDEAIKDNLWFKRYGNYLSYQKLIGVMRLNHVDNGIVFHCKCLPCLRVYQCAKQTLKKHRQACLNAYLIDCTNSHTARLSDV